MGYSMVIPSVDIVGPRDRRLSCSVINRGEKYWLNLPVWQLWSLHSDKFSRFYVKWLHAATDADMTFFRREEQTSKKLLRRDEGSHWRLKKVVKGLVTTTNSKGNGKVADMLGYYE